jgi:hypothetical protein
LFKIIPERDVVYFSGVLDSEGSIFIKKSKTKKSVIHSLELEIVMTHKPTIERLHNMFGIGSMRAVKRNKAKHHKQAWKVVFSANQAETILNVVLPYMITKKEEAELALEFVELKRSRVGRSGLSEEMIELREMYYQKMKELKKIEYEQTEGVM